MTKPTFARILAVGLFLLVAATTATPAIAASFDCTKATAAVERRICASPELSLLDEQMAAEYLAKASARQAPTAYLEQEQQEWLRNTRDACRDDACLGIAYRKRLMQLRASWDETIATPTARPSTAQAVIPIYGPTETSELAAVQERLRAAKSIERMARSLSQGLRLPQQVSLASAECGISNAFYFESERVIVLCLELLLETSQTLTRQRTGRYTRDAIERTAAGAVSFVLVHELGHALIHILDVPVLGRVEDAADQISAYLLLNGPEQDAAYALEGALWLFRDDTSQYTRTHFADTHSLHPQRRFNLACWAYGKDPRAYAWVLTDDHLPPNRAPSCAEEYARLRSAMNKLIGKHLRVQ